MEDSEIVKIITKSYPNKKTAANYTARLKNI